MGLETNHEQPRQEQVDVQGSNEYKPTSHQDENLSNYNSHQSSELEKTPTSKTDMNMLTQMQQIQGENQGLRVKLDQVIGQQKESDSKYNELLMMILSN